jgi:malate synthase
VSRRGSNRPRSAHQPRSIVARRGRGDELAAARYVASMAVVDETSRVRQSLEKAAPVRWRGRQDAATPSGLAPPVHRARRRGGHHTTWWAWRPTRRRAWRPAVYRRRHVRALHGQRLVPPGPLVRRRPTAA